MNANVKEFMDWVVAKNPGETLFHQAVEEVVSSLMPFIEKNPKYKAAKILERARIKAQRKMNFQGPDSLNQLYNYVWSNDREVKAEGLQGFRRDTILTNMIQSLYKGQYTEENIGEIIYIPHTDNVKFEVETNNGYTTSQGIKVPIFEIRAHYNTYLHDLNNQERVNLIDKEEKLDHYPGLKIGSVDAPNNNAGNWE